MKIRQFDKSRQLFSFLLSSSMFDFSTFRRTFETKIKCNYTNSVAKTSRLLFYRRLNELWMREWFYCIPLVSLYAWRILHNSWASRIEWRQNWKIKKKRKDNHFPRFNDNSLRWSWAIKDIEIMSVISWQLECN